MCDPINTTSALNPFAERCFVVGTPTAADAWPISGCPPSPTSKGSCGGSSARAILFARGRRRPCVDFGGGGGADGRVHTHITRHAHVGKANLLRPAHLTPIRPIPSFVCNYWSLEWKPEQKKKKYDARRFPFDFFVPLINNCGRRSTQRVILTGGGDAPNVIRTEDLEPFS